MHSMHSPFKGYAQRVLVFSPDTMSCTEVNGKNRHNIVYLYYNNNKNWTELLLRRVHASVERYRVYNNI